MRNHPSEVASRSSKLTRPRSITPTATRSAINGATGASRAWAGRPWPPLVRVAIELGGALIVVAAASWPLVFANATFNKDWLDHLWYMWHQSLAIRERGTPSLYLNYSGGIFYPLYAFYAGTLYALVGTLSLILGDAPLATYVLSYLLGFCAAYGGWYWIARSFGVRGWLTHMPGLVFITSASYLTTIYALGDWPEFLAVSVMPLMIASGLSVLRDSRFRFGPAIALSASSVVFIGSHLLTLIWGATILGIVAVALLACVPGIRHSVTRAGVLRLVALVTPAAMLSAWFLVPTAVYESHALIAHTYPHFRMLLRQTLFIVAAHNLFSLSRAPSPGSIVSLSLPVLAVAWVLVGVVMLARTGRRDTWMRVLLVVGAATVVLAVIMAHAGLILALPRMYAMLQFSFRLESFVLLGISGALVAVLVMAQTDRLWLRRWTWLLAPIAAVSVFGAAEQAANHPRGEPRSAALASYLVPPPERFGQFDYLYRGLPSYEEPLPSVEFPLSTVVTKGHASATVRVPSDRLVASNIRGGPDVVNVEGAKIVGLDMKQDDVLEVTPPAGVSQRAPASSTNATPSTATISVGPSDHLPIVAGRLISLIGLVTILGELGLIAVLGLRRRKTRPSSAG